MAASRSFVVCLLVLSAVRPAMAGDPCYDNCVQDGGWGKEVLCSLECLHPINPFNPEEPVQSPTASPSPNPNPDAVPASDANGVTLSDVN